MLTKKDLELIGDVVDQRIEARLIPIKKELKTMHKKLNRVTKDVVWMSKTFDGELSDVRKRVTVLERKEGIN